MTLTLHKRSAVVAIAWLVAWRGIAPAVSPAGQTARVVPDLTVSVELPSGWTFVG